jgi:hypothetical protein
MDVTCGGQKIASKNELCDILRLCLQGLPNTYIILDGVDECEDSNDIISVLFQACETSSTRLLLFSRPIVAELEKRLTNSDQILMNKSFI